LKKSNFAPLKIKNMKFNNVCPISKGRIDENKTRIIAFFVVVLASASIYYSNYYISGLLAVDFAIRAFSGGKASPVRLLAIGVSKLFRIREKPGNAAAKKFAAGMGVTFCFIIALLQWMQFNVASQIVGCTLIFFAILECAFGFCTGCKVYSFLQMFKKEKQ
jgi:hypothetical protein